MSCWYVEFDLELVLVYYFCYSQTHLLGERDRERQRQTDRQRKERLSSELRVKMIFSKFRPDVAFHILSNVSSSTLEY